MAEKKNETVLDPEQYFRKEEVERLKRYSENLTDDLMEIGLDQKKKEEYYKFLMKAKKWALAIDSLSEQYNSYNGRLIELKTLYENAPTDALAKKYLNEIQSIQAKRAELEKKHTYFTNKYESVREKVREIGNYIDNKLEELGHDLGKDDHPRSPKNMPNGKR